MGNDFCHMLEEKFWGKTHSMQIKQIHSDAVTNLRLQWKAISLFK